MNPLQWFFVLAFLLFLLLVTAHLMVKPFRLFWKFLYNSLLGIILLLVINWIGVLVDFSLPINLITILIAGFLGLPGLILLIILSFLLGT